MTKTYPEGVGVGGRVGDGAGVGVGVTIKFTGLDAGVLDGTGEVTTAAGDSTTQRFVLRGSTCVSNSPDINCLLSL